MNAFKHLERRPVLAMLIVLLLLAFTSFLPGLLVLVGHKIVILDNSELQAASSVGDAFGASNAFFSGIGLLIVAYTLLLQKRELIYQREDLKLTRQEMTKNTEAQIEQSLRMEKSAKIAVLTQLYEHYNNIEFDVYKNPTLVRALATGRKQWVVRNLHMLIESNTDIARLFLDDMNIDFKEMKSEIARVSISDNSSWEDFDKDVGQLRTIAIGCGNFIAEEKIDYRVREKLISLYDAIHSIGHVASHLSAVELPKIGGYVLAGLQKDAIVKLNNSCAAALTVM